MDEPLDPNAAVPFEGPLDDAMRAGFRRAAGSHSVLARLAADGGPPVAVLLRDEGSDGAPIVLTRSPDVSPREEGRYQMLGEIARGGVGVVLKGRDIDLGRDVAMKVLRDEHAGRPEILARFVEEAQIGGQLQHPGIVPVYELGVRADRRPYFTMKLIKGQTLSVLLQERPDPSHERRRFLSIFEAVCQTMAYAHARGVIHRDLKPSNVMVGAFGEVQVVDWGLAKVLARGGVADEKKAGAAAAPEMTVIATIRTGSTGSESMAGSVMGTPAYMPPEQAQGDVEAADERSDVFSLGAILCEVLTGQAPYAGDPAEVYRKAVHAELGAAHARLAACGADRELIEIARICLTPARQGRPKNAGVVAKEIGAYLASVEERARAAQLAAAEAKVKAAAERRARKLTLALAAAVVAVVLVGGGAYAWVQNDRVVRTAEANRRVEAGLAEASRLRGQATGAGGVAAWQAALSAARNADVLARSGDADGSVRAKAASLLADVEGEADGAKVAAAREAKNLAMLARLEEIRERTADEDRSDPAASDAEYAAAFQDFGIDPDALAPEEAKERLLATGVTMPLAFALDDWARVRRTARKGPTPDDARLTWLAGEADPDPWRTRLREAKDRPALQALAASRDTASAPFEGLVRLGSALHDVGDRGGAVAILRAAWPRHPEDFWCNYELARTIKKRGASKAAEPFLRAALALRPRSAVVLVVWSEQLQAENDYEGARDMLEAAMAARPADGHIRAHLFFVLRRLGMTEEAYETAKAAVRLSPDDFYAHTALGSCLASRQDAQGAVTEMKEALRLAPNYATGYSNLALALQQAGDLDGALAAATEAVRRMPENGETHFALARVQKRRGLTDEALTSAWEAVRLDPTEAGFVSILRWILLTMRDRNDAVASARAFTSLYPANAAGHCLLGEVLNPSRDRLEALSEFREALRLDSTSRSAENYHFNFAGLLALGGDVDGAISEYRASLGLAPDYAEAHCNLGINLQKKGLFPEALEELRKGHTLGIRRADWGYPSAQWVETAERFVELDPRLPALLRGDSRPADAHEAAAFAKLCYMKALYGASARLYALAFAPDGEPAAGVEVSQRSGAVCALALAGSGEGGDAASTDEASRSAWRSTALAFMRAELADHRKRMEDPSTYSPGGWGPDRWKEDSDLRGVRDAEALERLPEAERSAWRALWIDVDALLGRTTPAK